MVAMPLAHVSWALADNALRQVCDAFFLDVFGARTAHEMLITPETEHYGFDREERLMLIGDTMLIPIAPAGGGEREESPIGSMLRKNAKPGRWLGVSLRVADLKAADAWLRARDFRLHYDPGMENNYFLIGPRQALGMRIEVMKGTLPGDARVQPGWSAAYWRDAHPLGIEGLQSIGLSTPSLDEARALFARRLEWPELPAPDRSAEGIRCAAFDMGDTVLEAMEAMDADSALARHARDVTGIYCLTFKVRNAHTAADYLRGRGFDLIGNVDGRFAIAPEQAHGRLIHFTQHDAPGYPPLGSGLLHPAEFPQTAA